MTVPARDASPTRLRPAETAGREALWAMVIGVVSMVAFCVFYLTNTQVINEADPRQLVEFQGQRPYQLRVLLPALLFGATHFLSLPLVASYQLLIIGFALALFATFRLYLGQFCSPRGARWLALGIVPALWVFYSHRWFYLYDIPAAFFATLGLLLLVRERWRLYLLVFAVATVNRESSALLVLAFALTQWQRLSGPQFLRLLVAQAGIWLVARGLLNRLFAANPGAPVEVQLSWNISMLRKALFEGHAEFGFVMAVSLMLFLWITASVTSQYVPQFLRRARGVVVPFLALMTVVGVLTETRLYGEMIPFLLTPALVGLYGWNQARRGSQLMVSAPL